MKIAVTFKNGEVYAHFGHTEEFLVVTIYNNEIVNEEIVNTNGSGHTLLATLLHDLDVDVLICGGIGAGAIRALNQNNIRVCAGVSGNALIRVNEYLNKTLTYSDKANCDHHEHEDHECSCHHSKCDDIKLKRL